MRSKFSFVVIAAAILAAPAFAQDDQARVQQVMGLYPQYDGPSGEWDGVLVRNGNQTPIAVLLSENENVWEGWVQIDGASSPLERVRVAGGNLHFELPGEGVFEATFSSAAMNGSVSGSESSPGSFALTRQQSPSPFGDPIESQGP